MIQLISLYLDRFLIRLNFKKYEKKINRMQLKNSFFTIFLCLSYNWNTTRNHPCQLLPYHHPNKAGPSLSFQKATHVHPVNTFVLYAKVMLRTHRHADSRPETSNRTTTMPSSNLRFRTYCNESNALWGHGINRDNPPVGSCSHPQVTVHSQHPPPTPFL